MREKIENVLGQAWQTTRKVRITFNPGADVGIFELLMMRTYEQVDFASELVEPLLQILGGRRTWEERFRTIEVALFRPVNTAAFFDKFAGQLEDIEVGA